MSSIVFKRAKLGISNSWSIFIWMIYASSSVSKTLQKLWKLCYAILDSKIRLVSYRFGENLQVIESDSTHKHRAGKNIFLSGTPKSSAKSNCLAAVGGWYAISCFCNLHLLTSLTVAFWIFQFETTYEKPLFIIYWFFWLMTHLTVT